MENIKISESEFESSTQALNALLEYNNNNDITQDISNVVFVDVGAGMPEFYSNSLKFRQMGFKIIAIEPIPSFCALFRDKNWDVLEYAVTKDDLQGMVLFTEMRHSNDFLGLAGSGIKGHNDDATNSPNKVFTEYSVKSLSLNTILKTHHPELESFDVLDVDIEGGEIEILKGFNLDKYKPKVMIIENLNPDHNGYYDYYKEINYRLMAKCAHNDILIRK